MKNREGTVHMKNHALRAALFALLGIVAMFGLVWFAQGNQFFLMKVFAPAEEQVRRETFEESKAYRQGMVQELQSMRFQYEQASPEHRDALPSVILHRAADVDRSTLPPDLAAFIRGLEQGRVSK